MPIKRLVKLLAGRVGSKLFCGANLEEFSAGFVLAGITYYREPRHYDPDVWKQASDYESSL